MNHISIVQKLLVIVVGIIGILIIMALPWRFYGDTTLAHAIVELDGEFVNRAAPEFSLPDLRGEVHHLNDFKGQVVFLNFWASFCEPCRREMPSMESLVRQYTGQGMVMVAISLDTNSSDARQFMDNFLPGQRSAMTVLLDSDGATSTRFGTEKIPETYIIDRNGDIVTRFVGEYDWTRPEVKQIIEALL